MIFSRVKPIEVIPNKEYSELINRITTCEARLNALEIENTTLRNKVLRKIQYPRDGQTEETPQYEQFPKINTSPFSAFR